MDTAKKAARIILTLVLLGLSIWLAIISTGKAWYVWVPCAAIPILFVILCLSLMEDAFIEKDYHWEVFPRIHTGILIIFAISLGLMFSPMVKAHGTVKANSKATREFNAEGDGQCPRGL